MAFSRRARACAGASWPLVVRPGSCSSLLSILVFGCCFPSLSFFLQPLPTKAEKMAAEPAAVGKNDGGEIAMSLAQVEAFLEEGSQEERARRRAAREKMRRAKTATHEDMMETNRNRRRSSLNANSQNLPRPGEPHPGELSDDVLQTITSVECLHAMREDP